MHKCHTTNGITIELGLRVLDYDMREGVVVEAPKDYELEDEVCWPRVGHNGHWWEVCPDSPGHVHQLDGPNRCRGGIFDGSRLKALV